MATFISGQKIFKPTPPDKGSFPLDHEGLCKTPMMKFLKCLADNKSDNTVCRQQSKAYFECRMENNLMAKEDWSKLGYSEDK